MALINLWKGFIIVTLSLSVITTRVGYYIVTPLWLDYFKGSTLDFANTTNDSRLANDTMTVLPLKSGRSINATFLLVGQWGFVAVLTGLTLLGMILGCPNTLSDINYKYPKYQLFLVGFAMAMSSLSFNYALSGSRTPPYLQAVLGNFNIPIQFTIR